MRIPQFNFRKPGKLAWLILAGLALGLMGGVWVLQNRMLLPLVIGGSEVAATETGLPTIASTPGSLWIPAPGTTWDWQLNTPLDTTNPGQVYDIDLFDNDAGVVSELHAQGRRAICYISAGTLEDWRPDSDQFPAQIIGNPYEGWPGEYWLDIRRIDLLAPLMQARLDLCQSKGFDAVEPDNMDGFSSDTGFDLSQADQIQYATWLAGQAHQRGLSIGLKNASELVPFLQPIFDWAITEDCFAEGWCDEMGAFVQNAKAVFMAEYTDTGVTMDQFCPYAQSARFSAILKHRQLDAFRQACP
jgi:hypothetical protein